MLAATTAGHGPAFVPTDACAPTGRWRREDSASKMASEACVRFGPACTYFEAARARARTMCTHLLSPTDRLTTGFIEESPTKISPVNAQSSPKPFFVTGQ